MNQALSSATNFALSYVLVRTLPPASYGLYGIGTSICYLFAGFGNALLLTQLVVHFPEKPDAERLPYAARILAAVALLSAAMLVAATAGTLLAMRLGAAPRSALGPTIAVAVASATFLLKDYFVRQAYTAGAESRALVTTCAVTLALAALLGIARLRDVPLGLTGAFMVFAGAQLAGAIAGWAMARLPVASVTWRQVRSDLAECSRQGVWAIGVNCVTYAQTNAYAYVTVSMLGAASVGRVNAARLLVTPFVLLVPAIGQVMIPRLVRLRLRDEQHMIAAGKGITVRLLALAVLYSAVLIAAADRIARVVLGAGYASMRGLVIAWSVALLMMLVREGAATLLQAMNSFRSLASWNAVSAAVAVASVIALVHWLGAPGAVVGTAAGDGVLAVLLWRSVTARRGESAAAPRAG